MTQKFNAISFFRADYEVPNQYPLPGHRPEIDEAKLMNDIRDFIRIAMRNGYQMKIWYDGLTVCIEYNYQDESLSGVSLNWLGENEYVDTYEPVTAPNNNAQKGNQS